VTRFGNPVLGKMLKGMEKQRADATKAQARGARGGRTPDEGQLATMLGMQRLRDAMETAMWADRMLYQYGKRTQTTGDPHWNVGRPVDVFTDDRAGARGVDAERFRRMGPDFLRNR
jgi:hypothetical protein